MPDVTSLMVLAEQSPLLTAVILVAVALLLVVVGGVAAALWTRWMGRIERRLDIVEDEQRELIKHTASRGDIDASEARIQSRLDRLELRIDHAARDAE